MSHSPTASSYMIMSEGAEALLHPSEHPLSAGNESSPLPSVITEPFITTGTPEHGGPLYEHYKPVRERFIHTFPLTWEDALRAVDDTIIKAMQAPLNSSLRLPVIGFALALTIFTSIEFGLMLPFALYLTGFDQLADRASWLMLILALISQIPKRFVWRSRPWMVQRAIRVRKDKTSSFPSRAVTCAIVYGVMIGAAVAHSKDTSIDWSLTVGISIAFAVLASMARIIVGAHYPSDCAGGFVSGTVNALIGTGLYQITVNACLPCIINNTSTNTIINSSYTCYASDPSQILTMDHGGLNWLILIVSYLIVSVFLLLLLAPPLHFWSKASFVLGILVPCFIFRFIWLCPPLNGDQSLAQSSTSHSTLSFVLAIIFALLLTGVAKLLNALKSITVNFIAFILLSVLLLIVLALYRLSESHS